MSINRGLFSSARGDWETPQEVFDALDAEFHFTLDACASPENAKCAQFYTIEDHSLLKPWTGRVFVNPPYGRRLDDWVNKAWISTKEGGFAEAAEVVVMLLPSRTDTKWFQLIIQEADEIRFIRGRLKFGGAKQGAPFPSAIVVFRRQVRTRRKGTEQGAML